MAEYRRIAELTSVFLIVFVLAGLARAQTPKIQDKVELNDSVLNCEMDLVYQDFIVNLALEERQNGGVLIVIVRSGDGESSRDLMRRRIYNVQQFYKERGSRLGSDGVVVAEGFPAKGHGRVEYYVKGRLVQHLLFRRNGYICHSCCGPDSTYYPDKNAKKRTKGR